MFTKAVFLLAALYAREVLSSRYHGPITIPHVLHNGHIADTHEVAAAKAEHLAAVTKAKAHGGHDGAHSYESDLGYAHSDDHSSSVGGHGDFRYHGPIAIPHVLHNGHIADTHEVAAAKVEHLAAVTKAKAYGGHEGAHSYGSDLGYAHSDDHSSFVRGHGDFRYHGPIAIPHVLHNGHIADTHEVAAAKVEHLAAVIKAKAHGGHEGAHSYGSDLIYAHSDDHSSSVGGHGDFRYHGPTAIPHVLHNGHIADTHEVAAAKAEHLAAVTKAKAHGGHDGAHSYECDLGYAHSDDHSSSVGGHGDFRYHGPIAIPHVLHNGHIADTHEVAAAKVEHLAAVTKAKAHGGHEGAHSYGSDLGYAHNDDHSSFVRGHGDFRYHGPIATPHVLHNGHIADTHEVTAAKVEHLAAVIKAKAHGGHEGAHSYGSDLIYAHSDDHSSSVGGHGDFRYHGPTAIPHVLHNGHIADTHEVAAAKVEHLTAVTKAKAHGGHEGAHSYGSDLGYVHSDDHSSSVGGHGDFRYHGPTAIPHVLHNGHIADTHEVAAAKAEHLATVSKAHSHGGDYRLSYNGGQYFNSHNDVPYHGPLANPVVLHTGYLADTNEVASAKQHHLQHSSQRYHHY